MFTINSVSRRLLSLHSEKTTGVLADLDPPPGPYPLAHLDPLSADLDPLTKFSENITIHNFLVESDNNSESRF